MTTSLVNSKKKNINQIIANKFRLLADYHKFQNNTTSKFKASAFRKAADNIEFCDTLITTPQIAIDKAGISDKIAKRIQEILDTGTLSELNSTSSNSTNTSSSSTSTTKDTIDLDVTETELDPIVIAMNELTSITGIGPKKAQTLIKDGFDTIAKLRIGVSEGKVKLTHHILLGLTWYEDLLERIPRIEMVAMENILQQTLKKINNDLILTISGSYRRGKETCGDIDCLITHKDSIVMETHNLLKQYVEHLNKIGFIVGDLTTDGDKKYMGICQLDKGKSKGRRIDIRCVEYENYFAALIYFTGSKNFNIKIRRAALEKGYSLNEYGFTKKDTGEKILVHSEEELFKIVGMKYVPPTERDI
jgi:DNA polymerase/3'-5' exonuclease PolX